METAPAVVVDGGTDVAVLLALASALVYGAADFCGGLASRRAAALAVVAASQLFGLLALLVLLPLLGGDPSAGDLLWGAAAGVAGAAALSLFYRALADGVMSIIAPITAVCAAAVPVLLGLATGERLTAVAVGGILLALVAIALVAAEDGLPTVRAAREAGLGVALLAGLGFGLFFVLLDQPDPGSGLWPLVGARTASITLVVVLSRVTRDTLALPRAVLPLAALGGVLDMAANALFLLAAREGLLAVAGVLASLYPVSTVLLALTVLRERLGGVQRVGLVVAVVAVALIAVPA
ncbi:EamA family transporter [Goekera deserti]|uniref:EamA family transporter n=1 Tax=Goekera deserti TaxID=2497753 RepID=UPI001F293A61|nr:EamA family transporter [Goekera deserti]